MSRKMLINPVIQSRNRYYSSRNPGHVATRSQDFRHEKALSQIDSQMSQCWSEAWSSACFTCHFGSISAGSCGSF
jgi:hypothetical protein